LQDAFVTPLDAFKEDLMAAADQMAVVGSQEEAVTKAIYDEISAMNALEQALLNASPEVKEARQKQAEAERLQAEADKAKAELDAVGGDDIQKKLEGILVKERDASLAYAHNIRELGKQESSIGGVNMGSFGRGINRITDYGTHDKQQNRLRNQYTKEMRQYDAQKQELQDKMATYNALKERADSASSAAKTAASSISPQEKAMLDEHERKVADAKSRANALVEKASKFDPSSGEQVQPLPKGYMTSPLNVLPSPASIDPLSRGTGDSDATTAMIEQLIGIRKNTEGKVGMVTESLT
jgi:vacuolar-type H+-ATPase subunit H